MIPRPLLTLVAVLTTAAPALAARPVAVALQDDQITNDMSPVTVTARAELFAGTGARITRVGVDWSTISPTRPAVVADHADPAYRWDGLDRVMRGFADRGVATMVVIYGTPAWATPSGKWNAPPPPGIFGRFVGALAQRYSGRSTDASGAALPQVKSISPGNEPNLPFWISPQCQRVRGKWVPLSPVVYAGMLRASYPRIKAANPDIVVVAGENLAGGDQGCTGPNTTLGTLTFLREVHKNLGRTRRVPFDAVAQHLHPIGPPHRSPFFPSWSTLNRVTTLVNTMHPRGRMPILVTETGYTTAYSAFHRYFVTETQQANWLELTYQLAEREPQVELVVWFNLQDNWDWPAGLYRDDGTAKPSLARFRQVAARYPVPAKWAAP
jgi:hypothetical protein